MTKVTCVQNETFILPGRELIKLEFTFFYRCSYFRIALIFFASAFSLFNLCYWCSVLKKQSFSFPQFAVIDSFVFGFQSINMLVWERFKRAEEKLIELRVCRVAKINYWKIFSFTIQSHSRSLMILMLVWVSYSILALDNCQPIRHPPVTLQDPN